MNVYETLVSLAESNKAKGYLRGYEEDLTRIDRKTLAGAQPGTRWIWTLRGNGTALFPVASGHDPMWCTYWLNQGNERESPSLTYLLTMSADGTGTVRSISYQEATRLANLPHPDGLKVTFSLSGDSVS